MTNVKVVQPTNQLTNKSTNQQTDRAKTICPGFATRDIKILYHKS